MGIVLPDCASDRNLIAGFSLCLVHPALASLLGAVSSPCQCSTSPLSFFKSKKTSECGFIKRKSVTVPFSVTGWLMS